MKTPVGGSRGGSLTYALMVFRGEGFRLFMITQREISICENETKNGEEGRGKKKDVVVDGERLKGIKSKFNQKVERFPS